MSADYLDIADDGTLVRGTAIEGGGDAFVRFGDDVPISVPDHVRNLVVRRDGRACAFKSQGGTCYLVTRSGHKEPQGPVYGDEAVAFTPDGRLVFVTSRTHYVFGGVPLPLPTHRVGTTQGIIEARDDGSILWTDDQFATPRDLRTFGGVEFNKFRTRGQWTFGLSQVGCALFDALTLRVSVAPQANATSWTPRGAVVNGVLLVAVSQPGIVLTPTDWQPYVPAPIVVPPPVVIPPVEEPPVSVIPTSEIIAATAQSKAEVEALGYTFKTVEEAMRDNYAHYTYADKQMAFLVTMRAAWKLAQQYPNAGIGLEVYEGVSGTPSPFPEDGPTKYSGDIILLSKRGPSCDILIAGVQPAAQVDDTTDPQAPANWARDWRPPINPYRHSTPPVTEQPPVPPVTPPTPPPHQTVDLSHVIAKLDALSAQLHAHRGDFDSHRQDMAEREVALRNEMRNIVAPTYSGIAKAGWPVGTITFTLTPEES